jgi:hypothetical protein
MRYVVGLTLLVCIGAAVALAQTAPALETGDEFSSFGLRVHVPETWTRVIETKPDMIAQWSVPGASGAAPAVVTLEITSARGKSFKAYAGELAATLGAMVQEDPGELDGEKPTRISGAGAGAGAAEGGAAQKSEILMVMHEGFIYTLTASSSEAPAAELTGMLEDVRKSWRFCPMALPALDLTFRAQPTPILDRFTLKVPARMRPAPSVHSVKGTSELQIFNYRSGRPDVLMTAQVAPRPAGTPLEKLGDALIAQIALPREQEDPIKWKKVEGSTPRILCAPFLGARSGSRLIPVQFALIDLGGRDVVLLGFVYPTSDQSDRGRYQDRVEAMVASVEPMKK